MKKERTLWRGRSNENYLNFVPRIIENSSYEIWSDEEIVLSIIPDNLRNKLRKLFNLKVKERKVHLDQYGKFLWNRINGVDTVENLLDAVVDEFQEDRLTLSGKIVVFFEILKYYHFVDMIVKEPKM